MAIADVVLCVYKGREKEGDSRCLEWESNCHDAIVNSTVHPETPAAVGTTILFYSQTLVQVTA